MPQLCRNCTGCGSCTAICPKNAISLEEDEMGYLYPRINKSCVACNLCSKMCSLKNEMSEPLKVYGLRHKNIEELTTSRSGGFFAAVSEYVLSNYGVVYGSCLNSDLSVSHKRITQHNQILELKKSKYTHSIIEKSLLEQLIQDLKSGKLVLFSGTGCQVGKLKQLLTTKKVDTTSLLLMDIICHGVPTQKLWKDYVQYVEHRFHSKIKIAEFRDKSIGWIKPFESFTFKGFYPMPKHYSNTYTKLFYSNNFLRESCFNCEYATTERTSDFTIGDYWGWEKSCPGMNNDNKGISLVFLNSSKALLVFSKIENKFNYVDCTEKDYMQKNLHQPTEKPYSYNVAQKYYLERGFNGYIKAVGLDSASYHIKEFIRSLMFNLRIGK